MNLTLGKKLFIIFALGLFCFAGIGHVLYSDATLRTALFGPHANADQGQVLAQSFRNSMVLVATGYAVALAILLLAALMITQEFSRHKQSAGSLHELRERLRLFTDGLTDCAQFMLDAGGKVTQWDAAAELLHGFTAHEVRGNHFSMLFPDEELKLGKPEHFLKTAEAKGRCEQVGWLQRKNSAPFQAHYIVTPIKDDADVLQGFSMVTRDVTALKQNEELLGKLSLTLEQAADLVVIADRNGALEYVNSAVEEVTGYTREELLANGLDVLRDRTEDPNTRQSMWDTVLSGRPFHAEMTSLRKNGEEIFLDAVVTPIKDSRGRITHAVFTGSDVTPLKLMRDKLDYLASYDSVTGLPNRNLFAARLGRHVSRNGNAREAITILAIDIDRFKFINEIYGLEAGDKVLKQVAESLSVSVNKSDTVGRLGSDEFGIVLYDVKRPADVLLFVKMIMKNVPQIVMSGGEEISVTLATGIAMYPEDGKDALTLMKNADTALSKAKALGRNRYEFYRPDMNVGISEVVFMERRLSDALRNKEFVLSFQPYCYLSSRKIVGAEALLKWTNDEFGQVSPAKFIPMLEETGMIIDVGKWVLKTACRQIKAWPMAIPAFPVSVNLSPIQFRHEFLVETVENTIRDAGIDPGRLTLEVTESTFMKDQDFAISVLKRLKDLGVSVAIDDFGTGYSSLSYLKKFPVDFIKIDQSFIKDVATDPDTMSLVTAIISMAHSLGLKTIAEGIETEAQWNILRLLKCDMGQGYYFSRAVSPQEFEKLLG